MEQELQSVLLEDFEISFPGFSVLRVALNQHMPRVEKLRAHNHDFGQVLLYLRGEGTQYLGDGAIEVRRGSVLSIRAHQVHRFAKRGERRPLCLAIDLRSDDQDTWPSTAVVSAEELARFEEALVDLNRISNQRPRSLAVASSILGIVNLLREGLDGNRVKENGPVARTIRKQIERQGFEGLRPKRIAEELGCTLDHLNRRLRSEAGLTVGDLISEARLKKAESLLRNRLVPIGQVGTKVGIDDQNYFARWFRKQTGQSPTRWRSVSGC